MGATRLLLFALLLLLLPRSGAPLGPFAALSPPLTVPAADGQQRRRLVACVASELPPGAPPAALWIGAGGRPLRALARGAARGGTAATVSALPDDADSRPLACHVGTDPAAPWRSSEPLNDDAEAVAAELCVGPGGQVPWGRAEAASLAAAPRACAAIALLVAVRLLLLKVLLFDALLTALLLAAA